MSRSPAKKPRAWPETGMLGGAVLVVGLVASGTPLPQALVALGVGASVLLIAWLWERTLRRAETASPLTLRQRTWNAAVFVVALAALAWVAWWCAANAE